jgi:hypothetical protein
VFYGGADVPKYVIHASSGRQNVSCLLWSVRRYHSSVERYHVHKSDFDIMYYIDGADML